MSTIREFIEKNPLPEGACVHLDEAASYRNIRYLDLLHEQESEVLPDAVIEVNGQPIMYLIRKDLLGTLGSPSASLAETIRTLACRADARFLGVITPGTLSIYPIEIVDSIPAPIKTLDESDSVAIRDFLTGAEWPNVNQKRIAKADDRWLDAFLLSLLNAAAETLREGFTVNELTNANVISLIGRALFSRFLTDREIVSDSDIKLIAPRAKSLSELYVNTENAASTFRWLDKTFNGDLLPLEPVEDYEAFFARLGEKSRTICKVLTDVQYGSVNGQLELGWKGLRFKHIPVDVLSQVYESFYHKFLKQQAIKESVHYTPRCLAELLVDGAFSVLDSSKRHVARVLDPAVGAGIFLVLSLRRLVQERWKATGIQPDRAQIRAILNNQLRGLDLNPEALKVAALSLYLAALDLDPSPQPLSDLKFEHLFGKVLHCVNDQALGLGEDSAPHGLGSLSPYLNPDHPEYRVAENVSAECEKFQIVIGNPPWTSVSGKIGTSLESVVRESIKANGLEPGPSSKNLLRYQTPDQPFLWKATQWVERGGAIALLLDAALLFQPESQRMRTLIFQAVRVTGILNGTALRQTMVWPTVSAQFCLLVAKNERPHEQDSFYYINPIVEPVFNERGLFRIDPHEATPVPCNIVQATPTIFKTLFRGNGLDVDLIRRLNTGRGLRFGKYLEELNLKLEVGYIRGKDENRTRDASFLLGLKDFKGEHAGQYSVQVNLLDEWDYSPAKLQWPRNRDTYRAPLLLFRKAAKLHIAERGALLCSEDVAYSESFYGVSLKGAKSADDLAAYFYLLSYSSLFVYFQLMTSSKFGVERDTFHKEDYEKFPVRYWADISIENQDEVRRVAAAIAKGAEPWRDVDAIVEKIYNLSRADTQLIRDSIEFSMPHSRKVNAAAAKPAKDEIKLFLDEVSTLLKSFIGEKSIVVRREEEFSSKSFEFFSVTLNKERLDTSSAAKLQPITEILSAPLFASNIRIKLGPNQWLIGQLAQRRYWSKTRARLFALDWLDGGFVGQGHVQ
ncbi:N-6 DNA methylase [Massilia oculi]|uniref:N-6 DNA methylase n=1 Tax=Massilia oculi TaxID=945844 RepID=UPI0028AC1E44|nr:N-6 DNA methylase [Massilia oculi]